MRNCSFEEIRGRLKISIKDCNKFIVFYIAATHGRLEIASLIALSDHSMSVFNVGIELLPFIYLLFDQQLGDWIIRVIKNLNQ